LFPDWPAALIRSPIKSPLTAANRLLPCLVPELTGDHFNPGKIFLWQKKSSKINGLIFSEYAARGPGPARKIFPRRNRIISGLCQLPWSLKRLLVPVR
jgi:hypothetical protein